MASLPTVEHRNQEATCYVGNLDPQVDDDLLFELFNNVGHVLNVHMPKDKLTNVHNGYGFVEFRDEIEAEYAIQILNMVKLYDRPLRVSKSALDKKSGAASLDVGANLFIGNLDPVDVDEKLLHDTFSAFGTLIKHPKIMRDEATNQSKGFGFVSYDCFESSDLAIECMNNQFLCNRLITVQYAFKRTEDAMGNVIGVKGERHGSQAERMLAASNPVRKLLSKQNRPNMMFAVSGPPSTAGVGVGAHSFVMHNVPPPPLPPMAPPLTSGKSVMYYRINFLVSSMNAYSLYHFPPIYYISNDTSIFFFILFQA